MGECWLGRWQTGKAGTDKQNEKQSDDFARTHQYGPFYERRIVALPWSPFCLQQGGRIGR